MKTTTTLCALCGAVLTNGSRLCPTDTEALMNEVRNAHDLLAELETTLTRQDRVAAATVGGRSSEVPLPYNVGASRATDELRASVRAMARGDIGHDEVRRFRTARSRAMEAIDIPDPRVFVGVCDCETPVYARKPDIEVACRSCGAVWDAAPAATDNLFEQIGHHTGTAAEVAGLLRMAGLQVPTNSLQWWARAGYVVAVGKSRRGYPTYRIADVVQTYAQRARKQRRAS